MVPLEKAWRTPIGDVMMDLKHWMSLTWFIVGLRTLSIGYKVLQGINPLCKGSKALEVGLGGINDNL